MVGPAYEFPLRKVFHNEFPLTTNSSKGPVSIAYNTYNEFSVTNSRLQRIMGRNISFHSLSLLYDVFKIVSHKHYPIHNTPIFS